MPHLLEDVPPAAAISRFARELELRRRRNTCDASLIRGDNS
jgi:hypothetical protein